MPRIPPAFPRCKHFQEPGTLSRASIEAPLPAAVRDPFLLASLWSISVIIRGVVEFSLTRGAGRFTLI